MLDMFLMSLNYSEMRWIFSCLLDRSLSLIHFWSFCSLLFIVLCPLSWFFFSHRWGPWFLHLLRYSCHICCSATSECLPCPTFSLMLLLLLRFSLYHRRRLLHSCNFHCFATSECRLHLCCCCCCFISPFVFNCGCFVTFFGMLFVCCFSTFLFSAVAVVWLSPSPCSLIAAGSSSENSRAAVVVSSSCMIFLSNSR